MARKFFAVEKGLDIHAENGDIQVRLLSGSGAPTATFDQNTAPIGSLYLRTDTGELYQKQSNSAIPSDWTLNGASEAQLGAWRPERVDLATNDTLTAGSFDPTTLTDNDDGIAAASLTVGNYVIGDADGTPALFEITAIAAPNVTIAAAASPMVNDDMFSVKYYLPDPAGQENQAVVVKSATVMVKVADADWGFANAISLTAGYAAGSGDISSADTVQSAIQKLDGNNDAQDSLLGTSQGDTNLGTMGGTGTVITDNNTVKGALEQLDDQVTQNDSDIATNAGNIATNTSNISTNAGNIATNTSNISANDADIADLQSLSGRPDDSTDHGLMDQGDILSDNATTNALFKETDAELTRQRGKVSATGVTTLTTIDSVLVDDTPTAAWLVSIRDTAIPAKVRQFIVHAGHNGHSAADATLVDDSQFSVLKFGSSLSYTLTIDINGTGPTQEMRLRVSSTEPSGVNVEAKRIEVLF